MVSLFSYYTEGHLLLWLTSNSHADAPGPAPVSAPENLQSDWEEGLGILGLGLVAGAQSSFKHRPVPPGRVFPHANFEARAVCIGQT